MHLKLYSDDEDDDRGCYPMAGTPTSLFERLFFLFPDSRGFSTPY